MHILQLQNIKRDVAKKLPIDALNIINNKANNSNNSNNSNEINETNENKIETQTTNIHELPSDDINQIKNEEPKPIMEYENFGAEIK